MIGKGDISVLPNRRLRMMLAAHLLWIAIVCVLGVWWGRVLMRQANRIAELEAQIGLPASAAQAGVERMQRMMFWESSTFFAILLAATAIVFWMYWRDVKRMRSLQAFFASVTHELRTPLTSIRLQAESIAEQLGSEGAFRESNLIARLLEDTSRLESQVERTLELARVEGGGSVLTQPFPLKPWLEYFLKTWNETHGTRLKIQATLADCQIMADPGALQVILRNLLDNSSKHSGKSGAAAVRLMLREQDGWVVLDYSDDGKGFNGDPRKLGMLFEKGSGSQGAGVGLYLVSVLMKRMGGRAQFKASPALETSLWFRKAMPSHDEGDEGDAHG